jgi:hypothetical protein
LANIFLKRTDLEDLFWNVTEKLIGLDPTLQVNANKVRIAWPTGGAPAWKINDDVTFIRIGDADDPLNIPRDTTSTPIDSLTTTLSMTYTRVLTVHWSLYGPNSYDNAFLIRNNLYNQSIHDQLANSNIYIVTEISTPIRAPELFADQWWEHTSMQATFNEYIKIDNVANLITTPVIITKTTTI